MATRNGSKSADEVIKTLAQRFPQLGEHGADLVKYSDRQRAVRLPLVRSKSVGRRRIVNALFFYCSRLMYLEALREGAPRVSISGQLAGRVTADESQHAAERVKVEKARRATKPSGLGDLKMAAQRRRNGA